MAIINAALMRPIALVSHTGEQAGLEIVAKNGDQFLVPLSGEGMQGLIQDMQLFGRPARSHRPSQLMIAS
jgi:hypothetical protein